MELVERGAKLITGCRDLKKAADVVKIVKEKYGVDILVEKLNIKTPTHSFCLSFSPI